MTEPNKKNTVDEQFKALSGWKKARYIIAGICFVCSGTFVFLHLGFVTDDTHYNHAPAQFLSRENLWITNLILGTVGGILFAYKRFLTAGLSGLIAGALITGSTLFYLSWRDTVYTAELVLPLATGLIGVAIYKSLYRNK